MWLSSHHGRLDSYPQGSNVLSRGRPMLELLNSVLRKSTGPNVNVFSIREVDRSSGDVFVLLQLIRCSDGALHPPTIVIRNRLTTRVSDAQSTSFNKWEYRMRSWHSTKSHVAFRVATRVTPSWLSGSAQRHDLCGAKSRAHTHRHNRYQLLACTILCRSRGPQIHVLTRSDSSVFGGCRQSFSLYCCCCFSNARDSSMPTMHRCVCVMIAASNRSHMTPESEHTRALSKSRLRVMCPLVLRRMTHNTAPLVVATDSVRVCVVSPLGVYHRWWYRSVRKHSLHTRTEWGAHMDTSSLTINLMIDCVMIMPIQRSSLSMARWG